MFVIFCSFLFIVSYFSDFEVVFFFSHPIQSPSLEKQLTMSCLFVWWQVLWLPWCTHEAGSTTLSSSGVQNVYKYSVQNVYKYLVQNVYKYFVQNVYKYFLQNVYKYFVQNVYTLSTKCVQNVYKICTNYEQIV